MDSLLELGVFSLWVSLKLTVEIQSLKLENWQMFNRFHNYVVEQLAVINENGRFTRPQNNLIGAKKLDAWKKFDNDLFQTGRLITCGLYINIILLDYLRTIVGLNHTNSDWHVVAYPITVEWLCSPNL